MVDLYVSCGPHFKFYGRFFSRFVHSLHSMADFRGKRRIPLISWIHPAKNAVLLRAAQPLRGIMGQRCEAEERFVHETGSSLHFC